jgi:hypothetical protein
LLDKNGIKYLYESGLLWYLAVLKIILSLL